MQTGQDINISSLKEAIGNCCRSEMGCASCDGKQCLIGFAKIVSDYASVKKALTIPNGLKMVPMQDFKVYETDEVAKALSIINLECKNCMDNHDDNCVINIMRSTLEVALMGQHIDFTGSPLSYIMALTRINPELGEKVLQHYNALKYK